MTDPSFDWVSARATCCAAKMFHKLRMEIENDVDVRNKQRQSPVVYEFSIISPDNSPNEFSVLVTGGEIREFIVIKHKGEAIQFFTTKRDAPDFEATLSLNREGQCCYRVDGQECLSWEVRKKALEELFFVAIDKPV